MRAPLVALLVAGLWVVGATGQERLPREPILQKTTVGSELFRFYCANCHGLDAKGRPATAVTRTPASDLTRLSHDHAGVFPRDAVRGVLAHGSSDVAAHGGADMPVWGTIFRALEPNDALAAVRIDNLLNYIESLQTSAAGTHAAH